MRSYYDIKLQRRHFELIAETIKALDVGESSRAKVAAEFASALYSTNPQFSESRFIKACKPEKK